MLSVTIFDVALVFVSILELATEVSLDINIKAAVSKSIFGEFGPDIVLPKC